MLLFSQESCFWMEACAWQGVGHGVGVSGHPSSWRQRSALAATFRRMWGGVIPASAYKQCIGVAFKRPVIILHVSFRAMSTCPVCLERPHEEQAYSAVEKQSANE